ncbi:MAG: proprotein convertase P-domain-containing protein [Polyangiaceae bacterium]
MGTWLFRGVTTTARTWLSRGVTARQTWLSGGGAARRAWLSRGVTAGLAGGLAALGGCNLLVGLDDVSIAPGAGGGSGSGAGSGNGSEPSGGDGSYGSGTGAETGGAGAASGGVDGDGPGASGGAGTTGTHDGAGGAGGGGATGGSGAGADAGSGGTGTFGGAGGGSSGGGQGGSATGGGGTGGGNVPGCGDGVLLDDAEQCDDGGTVSGDGCTAGCKVEPFYQCTASGPSVCTKEEVRCLDQIDNDGDGAVDVQDTDCALPVYSPPQACAGLRIYHSVNVPMDVPDGGSAWSAIVVPEGFGVGHTQVILNIVHPRVSDVDVVLHPPFGQPRSLSTGNGQNGANYTQTVLDQACGMSVFMGVAPFTGCYKPESFLPANGQLATGTWYLEVSDHKAGQTGKLTGWTLVLCGQ